MDPGQPPFSPRRLRENEDLMEDLNARMTESLEEIRAETGHDADEPFGFFCECSSLACRDRVSISPRRLEQIHADPEQFVLLPGHEIPAIERIVDQEDGYLIVRKTA